VKTSTQNFDYAKVADGRGAGSAEETSRMYPAVYSRGHVYSHMGAGEANCTMAVIPVKVRMKNGVKEIETYAFMDPGSNVSFCTENLMNELCGNGKKMNITMNTMGVPHSMNTYLVRNLEISDLQSQNTIELPGVYTKDTIPVAHSQIPTQEDLLEWSHLDGIALPQINAKIGLLIGNNVPDAYTPLETRTGPRGSPHAAKTLLGWIAWNVLRTRANEAISVNRAEVAAIEYHEELYKLNDLYKRSVNLDFPEHVIYDRKEHSQEDKKFLSMMHSSKKLINGHYELCLPFREDQVDLPDNKAQALHRLNSQRNKMIRNKQFCDDYKRCMDSIIDQNYAERVPQKSFIVMMAKYGIYLITACIIQKIQEKYV
jgi:hypothetical protein